jgi:hypothetical protein
VAVVPTVMPSTTPFQHRIRGIDAVASLPADDVLGKPTPRVMGTIAAASDRFDLSGFKFAQV